MTDKIKLSKMSGKLTGITGINTNPLTNEYCKASSNTKHDNHICKSCYSCYMLKTFRKGCVNAFEYNSRLLSEHLLDIDTIPKIKTELCRIHAHGELINTIHLLNLVTIVKFNPNTTFALFTKRLDIVNDVFNNITNKPSNLIIVFSNPSITKVVTESPSRHIDKVFNVVKKIPYLMLIDPNTHICKGKSCINCKQCFKPGFKIIYEELRERPNINKTG